MITDERGKVPNYVIEGDPLRMRHQPTGLTVSLSSRNHAVVRNAQRRLRKLISEK